MKPFYKVCLIGGTALLFLGIIIGSIGFGLGWANGENYFRNYASDMGYGYYMENGTVVVGTEVAEASIWNGNDYGWEGSYNEILDVGQNKGQIESLKVEVGIAEVIISVDDRFHVEAINYIPENLSCTIENKTLVIKDTTDDKNWEQWISKSINNFFNEESRPVFNISIPEDFVAQQLTLIVGAGALYANELSATDVEITSGVGDINIEKLNVTGKSTYTIGAGDLNINDLTADNIKVNCGVGDAWLSGDIGGSSKLECGVGSLYVNTTADADDFNYKIDCGIGSVWVNDKSFDGIGKSVSIDNSADDTFTIKCGVGDVTLITNY